MGNQSNPNDAESEIDDNSTDDGNANNDNEQPCKKSEREGDDCHKTKPSINIPETITLHPADGNIIYVVPVYAYLNGQLVIIGYTETFYALDYSTAEFNVSASGTIPWIVPTIYEALKWGAAKAGLNFSCPVCSGAVWAYTVANGINDSVTIEGHLQTRFYFAVRHDYYSSDYNPFFPTYDPDPLWNQR